VLAAGAATAALARGLGLLVPVAGGKGYHVELAAADGDPRLPILVPEARCAVTPLEGRLRLTGTIELCTDDLGVDTRRLGTVRATAERVLRSAGGRPAAGTWAGLRPCAPDGLPVIGESDAVPGLVVATGHAFKGIALAPVTALLVAELVTGGPPSHDLSELSPDRFRPLLRRP
jgi:D-amino-acid dehydrogenase